MNYIERKARQLAEQDFDGGIFDKDSAEELLDVVKDDLRDVDSPKDKLTYLTIILEENDKALQQHKAKCDADYCIVDAGHDKVKYFLQQELERIGVRINNDAFTHAEKNALIEMLDKLMSEVNDVKNGQEILFEEIQELKHWFILGKKNWMQLTGAKVTEMVAGGIISEVTAKPLLGMIKEGARQLGFPV